jgi:hypothetical protein
MINRKFLRDDDEDDLLAAQDFLKQERQPSASVTRVAESRMNLRQVLNSTELS